MADRRIMRSFKMMEISAVDRPAQKHARMTIMKRDSTDGDTNSSHEKEVTDMTKEELQKVVDDAVKAALPAAVAAETATLTKKLNETTSQLESITKAKKQAPKAADDMSEPDADDATQKAWRPYVEKRVAKAIADTKAEIEAEIAKKADIAKSDETFEAEGTVIRKSEVGDASFKVMKAQHDKLETADFEKRVAAEIAHLPGETVAKAKALRAVSKLGKEDREAIETMLKSGEAALVANMKAIGHTTLKSDSSEAELNKLADAYAAEHKVTKAVAYTKVLETDQGKQLYTKSLTEKPRAA